MISPTIHARRPFTGLATTLALACLIATPAHGRVESRPSEHRPHVNAPPRPQAPMLRSHTAVAFPTAQMPPAVASVHPPVMDHPRETSLADSHDHHHERDSHVLVVVVPSVVYVDAPPLYSTPPADASASSCEQNFAIYDPRLGAYVDDAGNLDHCP